MNRGKRYENASKKVEHAKLYDMDTAVKIVKEIAGGYGNPGTVPMAWSAPEYDHDLLKPIAYDLDLARKYMEKAGYVY